MKVDHQVHVGPHGLADRRRAIDRPVEPRPVTPGPLFDEGSRLQRGVAAPDEILRDRRRRLGRPLLPPHVHALPLDLARPADVRVRAGTLAQGPPEQLVHWNSERFALQIPERDLDAGERTLQNRAALPERLVHRLPVMEHGARVLADQVAPKLSDGGRHRGFLPFESGLPDAVASLVGIDPDQHPTPHSRVHEVGRQLGDLHSVLTLSARRT